MELHHNESRIHCTRLVGIQPIKRIGDGLGTMSIQSKSAKLGRRVRYATALFLGRIVLPL